ncbi:MAG: GntR family transcriptional regulator [Clostridiaceae bacterium]|nr:GntR family transcriptional regulator [Clostridiaceae bacterium]
MKLDFNDEKAIYLQIADSIENDIIKDVIEEESQILSTNQMAILYKINPATAGKGINMLVDQGILYKKRGIGMFVSTGAKGIIREKRKSDFYERYIASLLEEARNLDIGVDELIKMIKEGGQINE